MCRSLYSSPLGTALRKQKNYVHVHVHEKNSYMISMVYCSEGEEGMQLKQTITQMAK